MRGKDLLRSVIFIALFLTIGIVAFVFYGNVKANIEEGGTTYTCDVKHFKLKTYIVVSDEDGNEIGTITGNVLKLLTDPLKMERNGEVIAYASDDYNIIGQDDHALVSGSEVKLYMNGGYDIIGNQYKVYDKDHNYLASINFDAFSMSGKLKTSDGTCIAEYYKKPLFRDYTVKIYDDSIDRDALLLLFASYYSDYSADNKAQNN